MKSTNENEPWFSLLFILPITVVIVIFLYIVFASEDFPILGLYSYMFSVFFFVSICACWLWPWPWGERVVVIRDSKNMPEMAPSSTSETKPLRF